MINIPHETYRLRQNEFDWLYGKLTHRGKIISLMDNDRVGKLESIWLKNNYNITPIIISKKYKVKDFAELVENNDIQSVITFIKVLPPFLILVAVRAIAPVAGIPKKNGVAILAIP